ncbi:MAG: 30S ribosomal protein S20 [bacterium]|nr:30S ribosomal protein S20 [bacterium]
MPLIKSAIKKVRKDKKRTTENTKYIKQYKEAIKKVKLSGGNVSALVKKVYSLLDKAVKHNVIHKNKGSRLKSRVSKLAKKKK